MPPHKSALEMNRARFGKSSQHDFLLSHTVAPCSPIGPLNSGVSCRIVVSIVALPSSRTRKAKVKGN
jgi:hypothetical protein